VHVHLRRINPRDDTVVWPHQVRMREESGIDERDRRATPGEARIGAHAERCRQRAECGFGVERPDALHAAFERPTAVDEECLEERLLDARRTRAVGATPARAIRREPIEDASVQPLRFLQRCRCRAAVAERAGDHVTSR
jgi:hypothetical protein